MTPTALVSPQLVYHADGDYPRLVCGGNATVVITRGRIVCDAVDYVHAITHLAKRSIVAVK